METQAKGKYLRVSGRKIRLLVNLVRNLDVSDAITQLRFSPKVTSRPLLKVIQSCVANAVHGYGLDPGNLYIKEARVDEGPVLKRWTPKAFGRAALVRKRMSHISILLAERIPTRREKAKMPGSANIQEVSQEISTVSQAIEPVAKTEEKQTVKDERGKSTSADPRSTSIHRYQENEDSKQKMGSLGKGKKFINKFFQRKTG
jgi:large subunit ribosomal protein L22